MAELKASTGFKVLIIGAGLGGLALAQSLRRSGISFRIFERDGAADSRPQGYRIKIHGDTTAVLRSILTPQQWLEFEETCSATELGETTINAISGQVTACRKGRPGFGDKEVYTVDRAMLRRVLLTGLADDEIVWGAAFERYELPADDENTVIAHFKDGSTAQGNLLVGADGSRSRVTKQLLPHHRVLDVEGIMVYGKTFITPELHARVPTTSLRWMTLCQDHSPVIASILQGENPVTLLMEPMRFPHRQARPYVPDDYIFWVLHFRKQLVAANNEERDAFIKRPFLEQTLEVAAEWHPSVRAILDLQDTKYTYSMPNFSVSPQITSWNPNSRVTVIGDAIHLMSPTGGVGAITAIRDAGVLGDSLAKQGLSVDSIGDYEKKMREYAAVYVQRSLAGGKKITNQPPFEACAVVAI